MFGRQAVGFLLFLAAGVLPGYGQGRANSNNDLSIDGYVRDSGDQHAMENIRVDLKQFAGIPVGTAFTHGNGEFEFSGLPRGEYVIEVKAKDYEPLQQTVDIMNGARRGMSIFLTKPMKAVRLASRASISAHQLSAPLKAQAEYDKGVNLVYDKSDFQGGIAQFQHAIKDFPTYYEAYAQEAIAYEGLKQQPAAEEALRKSVDLSSGKYADALILLSGLLNDTNRYQEAATFSRKAAEVDTGSWRGALELARALSGLKQMDEAEKSAIRARDLNPDNPSVYLILANIHISQRNYSSLVKDLDSFLKLGPDGPDADHARKTRDQVQEFLKRAEDRSRANSQGKLSSSVQDAAESDDASDTADDDPGPDTPAPDSSGLPPLPPAAPNDP